MTNQDEIVARAIEPKPDKPEVEHFEPSPEQAWYWDPVGGWLPEEFISAPIWPLEGIVLEWVQRQDAEFVLRFNEKLLEIIWGGIPQHKVREQLYEFVKFYKLGDWAKALLEVLDAKNS